MFKVVYCFGITDKDFISAKGVELTGTDQKKLIMPVEIMSHDNLELIREKVHKAIDDTFNNFDKHINGEKCQQ